MDLPGPEASWQEQIRNVPARLTQPSEMLRQLLGDIIDRALVAVGAAADSVMIPDKDGRHLRFLVSRGPGADKLADIKVPLDSSIACETNGGGGVTRRTGWQPVRSVACPSVLPRNSVKMAAKCLDRCSLTLASPLGDT